MAIFVPIVAGATLFTAPYLYQKASEGSDSLRKFRKNLTGDNTGSSTVGDNNADVPASAENTRGLRNFGDNYKEKELYLSLIHI